VYRELNKDKPFMSTKDRIRIKKTTTGLGSKITA